MCSDLSSACFEFLFASPAFGHPRLQRIRSQLPDPEPEEDSGPCAPQREKEERRACLSVATCFCEGLKTHNSTKVSHKSVSCKSARKRYPQECPTRVVHKSECPTRVSHEGVPQEFSTKVSLKSALQECFTVMSAAFRLVCFLQAVYSASVYAAGFVGSIRFQW